MGEGGWYYVPKVGSAESRWEYGDPFLIDTTAGASTEVCGEPKRKRREESFELGRTKGLLPLSHVTTLKNETNAAPLLFFLFFLSLDFLGFFCRRDTNPGLDSVWWVVGQSQTLETQHRLCGSWNCHGCNLSVPGWLWSGTSSRRSLQTHSLPTVVQARQDWRPQSLKKKKTHTHK